MRPLQILLSVQSPSYALIRKFDGNLKFLLVLQGALNIGHAYRHTYGRRTDKVIFRDYFAPYNFILCAIYFPI